MRLAVSKKSDLAVRILGELEFGGPPLSGSSLAERFDSSAGFVAQVLAPLIRSGWVDSSMGPSGGYSRTIQLSEISVRDVIEAIEGPTDLGVCVISNSQCDPNAHCALHASWSQSRAVLLNHLDSVTVEAALRS